VADPQLLTETQHARRARIIDAALALAAEGGYDAVQMREVAGQAEVALGTLYRYFPSKEHLLASAMAREVLLLQDRLAERPPRGDTAVERVADVVRRATRSLQHEPNATGAMLKAFVSAEPSMAPVLVEVGEAMVAIISGAIHHGAPSERDRVVARSLQYVWMASLASWVNGLNDASQVTADLEAAARVMLEGRVDS
jgi:AcrR family transcriptional regulator